MPKLAHPIKAAAIAVDWPSATLTYTLGHAAQITGLSISTLYRHAAAKRLRLTKVGGRTLVDARSLRQLLAGDGAINLGGDNV